MAGAAHRCVIPEHKFKIDQLTELLVSDRNRNPSRYAIVLVSEGAMFEGHCSMQPETAREDRKVTVFPKEERPLQAAGGQKQG